MQDSTAHVQDMTALVEVIGAAVEASSQFEEEGGAGSFRDCMTLFIRTAGGHELTVSVADPEQAGR